MLRLQVFTPILLLVVAIAILPSYAFVSQHLGNVSKHRPSVSLTAAARFARETRQFSLSDVAHGRKLSSVSGAKPPPTKLRVAAIAETWLPWQQRNSQTGQYDGGFLTAVYRELGYVGNFEIEFVPITDPNFFTDMPNVTRTWLDNNWIDLGWFTDPIFVPGYEYTQPMVDTPMGALVKKKTLGAGDSYFALFLPFTTELWIAIIVAIIFGTFTMMAINNIHSDKSLLDGCTIGEYFYHTTAAVLGGDEYDLYHDPPLGRLYRLGLLFLVLVISATYTANLAAFLTKPNVKIYGPANVEQLKNSIACVRYPGARAVIEPYVKGIVMPPPDLIATDIKASLPWGRQMLQDETCEVLLDGESDLLAEALTRCSKFHHVSDIKLAPVAVYNVLRGNETSLALSVSQAIMILKYRPAYMRILAETLNYGKSCATDGTDTEQQEEGTSQITLSQMLGMFFIYSGCAVLAVLTTGLQRVHNRGKPLGETKEEAKNEKLDQKLNLILQMLSTTVTGHSVSAGTVNEFQNISNTKSNEYSDMAIETTSPELPDIRAPNETQITPIIKSGVHNAVIPDESLMARLNPLGDFSAQDYQISPSGVYFERKHEM